MLLKVAGWAMVAHVAFTEPWYIGGVIGLFLLGAASTKDFAEMEGTAPEAARPSRSSTASAKPPG